MSQFLFTGYYCLRCSSLYSHPTWWLTNTSPLGLNSMPSSLERFPDSARGPLAPITRHLSNSTSVAPWDCELLKSRNYVRSIFPQLFFPNSKSWWAPKAESSSPYAFSLGISSDLMALFSIHTLMTPRLIPPAKQFPEKTFTLALFFFQISTQVAA